MGERDHKRRDATRKKVKRVTHVLKGYVNESG